MSEESFDPSDPFASDSEEPQSEEASGPIPQTPMPQQGNRPATGARQVQPGEAFTQDFFKGSENAGDFLGLDEEFTGSYQGPEELELAAPPTTMGAGGDEFDESPDFVPSTAQEEHPFYETSGEDYEDDSTIYVGTDDDEGYDDPADDVREEEPVGDVAYSEGEEYGEAEYDEEEYGEFGEEELVSTGGKKGLLVAAGFLVVLGIAGWQFGPDLWSRSGAGGDDGGTTIAQLPPDPTPVTQTADPDPVELIPTTDPTGDPIATTDPVLDPIEVVDLTGTEDPTTDPLAGTDPENGFGDLLDGLNTVIGSQDPTQSTGMDPFGVLSRLMGLDPGGAAAEFPDFSAGDYEWVNEDMLDMVWRGTEVPMGAITAPARTLMPFVGPVRVHMNSGKTFDGRLYAVGQDRVWIDARVGRIGLDGTEVISFEHLPMEASLGTGPAPTGGRVRVRVPGGSIYGKVLAVNGDDVTLITDSGGRIVLYKPNMEPLGSERAIVISH